MATTNPGESVFGGRQNAAAVCSKGGMTVVEMLVVVGIVGVLLALVLPALGEARRAAERGACAGRMRNIRLAVFEYDKRVQWAPNAQANLWRYVEPYLGSGPWPSWPTPEEVAAWNAEHFCCPTDTFLTDELRGVGTSYAPVVDERVEANREYTAWSYFGPADPEKGHTGEVWERGRLAHAASDTAILVEYWASENRANLDKETPAGYLLHDWGTGPTLGTIEFAGAAARTDIKAVDDVGGYTFLSAFGDWATRSGGTQRLGRIVHHGRMNLLHADGSVRAHDLGEITNRSPKDIPLWTRAAD